MLTLRYDKVGDILYIDKVEPYAEQDSNYIGNDVVARFNPVTNEIENLEIMFFSRVLETGKLELPIVADMRVAE